MSLAAIRDQIRTILSGVAGIGIVHEYIRWAVDWKKYLDLYKVEATGQINGWAITREKTPEMIYAQGGRTTRTHLFIIRGFYGLKDSDASELAFQDLVEAVCAAFRANDTLNGAALSCTPTDNAPGGTAGIQVEVIEPRMFGGVLCHYAELHLYAQELM